MSSDEGGPRRGGLGGRGRKRAAHHSDSDDGGGGLGFGGGGLGFGGKRGLSADDNILGVFAEGGFDSDDDRKGKGKGKGKRKKGGGILGGGGGPPKSMNFVKGATIQPVEIERKKSEKKEGEASDEEIDQRFIFNGPPGQGPTEHGPKLPAKNKLSFGQMQQNYGLGFAMLKKMGFDGGGLGRNRDGIANPIEVLKRQGGAGLQDEGERVDQDLYGTESAANRKTLEELLGEGSQKPKKDGPKASEGWKTGQAQKRQKTIYKTAEATQPGSMRIKDMRGPEVKVVSSFSELADSMAGDVIVSLKELRHNAKLLRAKYEDSIRAVLDKKRHYEDKLLAVASEKGRIEAASGLSDQEVELCRQTVKEIEALRERQDQGSLGLLELGQAFCKLRAERPSAFKALRLLDVALGLGMPTARSELADWKPLEAPAEGLGLLAPWRKLTDAEDRMAFGRIQDDVLLPRLRAALAGWKVRDVEPCLKLLERCRAALPAETVKAIGEELVLPRLRSEVETWDPRVEKDPVHLWIHPWLPLLGAALNGLWAPIRFKLSSMLDRWKPADRSAHALVSPWKLCFDASNWEPLIEKVLLRLERSVAELPVKPDGQDLGPIQDLLAWQDVVPLSSLASVLDVAFFPHWHAALRDWLRAPECDYGEVLQWYQGWKTLLPPELRDQGVVQQQYAKGLEVMKHHMARGAEGGVVSSEEEEEEAAPPPRASPSSAAAAADTQAAPAEDVTMSLADYLGEVAAEEGLVFRPKKDREHEGKQVYQFGAASIVMDRNAVWAAPKGGQGSWKLVTMDEVLALGKAAPKPKAR